MVTRAVTHALLWPRTAVRSHMWSPMRLYTAAACTTRCSRAWFHVCPHTHVAMPTHSWVLSHVVAHTHMHLHVQPHSPTARCCHTWLRTCIQMCNHISTDVCSHMHALTYTAVLTHNPVQSFTVAHMHSHTRCHTHTQPHAAIHQHTGVHTCIHTGTAVSAVAHKSTRTPSQACTHVGLHAHGLTRAIAHTHIHSPTCTCALPHGHGGCHVSWSPGPQPRGWLGGHRPVPTAAPHETPRQAPQPRSPAQHRPGLGAVQPHILQGQGRAGGLLFAPQSPLAPGRRNEPD